MFQSPCGVLGVCRESHFWNKSFRMVNVSVPLRGFRGLQVVPTTVGRTAAAGVSVPLRGFRGLQVSEAHDGLSVEQGFSPLAGF